MCHLPEEKKGCLLELFFSSKTNIFFLLLFLNISKFLNNKVHVYLITNFKTFKKLVQVWEFYQHFKGGLIIFEFLVINFSILSNEW